MTRKHVLQVGLAYVAMYLAFQLLLHWNALRLAPRATLIQAIVGALISVCLFLPLYIWLNHRKKA
ncbi:MAG: hypothetical protein PW735_02605 [Acidobacteriaceae bacterium]|nr:hypothetical protein [Acidobacteriaceae bacterium]